MKATSIEAIKARLTAATPGPWDIIDCEFRDGTPVHRIGSDVTGEDVATVFRHGDLTKPNAALVANAPTDIAFLLAEINRLKPRTVTTAAELDALPVGSVVLDADGDPWKKRTDGLWLSGRMLEDSETVFWCGPTPDDHPTVLHEGGAA